MFRILKALKLVAEFIPVIGQIFAILGKKKAEKRAVKAEKVIEAVVTGVEKFSKEKPSVKTVKEVIRDVAINLGAQEKLHELVDKIVHKK